MVELSQIFGGNAARASRLIFVRREVARAQEKEDATNHEDGDDREHGDSEVLIAHGTRPDRLEEAAQRGLRNGRLAKPARDEAQEKR